MPKDRKIDMVILGLLAHEDMTGYDIKKRIDQEISFFWKGSYGSIYPALNGMLQAGQVEKTGAPSGSGRERILYRITGAGRSRSASSSPSAEACARTSAELCGVPRIRLHPPAGGVSALTIANSTPEMRFRQRASSPAAYFSG